MWIFDSIKEKKRLRNEKCNDLINRATTSVESITSLFSDKRRFITADAVYGKIEMQKKGSKSA